MREVKGAHFSHIVKVIRANKQIDFNRWLTDEDWKIIRSFILPSQWYPLDTFMRAGQAIFEEVARQNLEVTRDFGKLIGYRLVDLYRQLIVVGDPVSTMEKYVLLYNIWFRGVKSQVLMGEKGRGELRIKWLISPEDGIKPEDAFAYLLAGNLDALLEKSQVKKPTVEVKKAEHGWDYFLRWE